MSEYFNNIKQSIINLPIRRKFSRILCIQLSIFLLFFILAFSFCIHVYNKLLYTNIAGALSVSSDTISKSLHRIEQLSSMLISNSELQEQLSILSQTENQIQIYNTNSDVDSTLFSFSDAFREYDIHFISIQTRHSTLCTNWALYHRQNQELMQELYNTAQERGGPAQWIWETESEPQLFLIRNIRQIKNLDLSPIGNLIMNVNMDSLVTSANKAVTQYGSSWYLITDESGQLLYQSKELDQDFLPPVENLLNGYGPISCKGKHYFYASKSIPGYHWRFINLVPFDSINRSLLLTYIGTFFIILTGFFLLFQIGNVFISSITIHLDALVSKMNHFSKDELSQPSNAYDYQTRTDEIGKLHQQCDLMIQRIQTLIQKNYVNEILKRDAQLKALEMQINPHFLYNTLESINWRAKAIGNTQISQMTESLGTLLRATLGNKTSLVHLSYELELVNCYLTIQKLRFEDELEYHLSVADDIDDPVLPPLSIQPLVENAIHYGMEDMDEICHIFITISRDHDHLFIKVQNDGSLMEENLMEKLQNKQVRTGGFGLGILNIDKRIKLLLGDSYGLSFSNENGFATALITLLYRTEV